MDESMYRLLSLILQSLGFIGAIITLIFIWRQIGLSKEATTLNTKAVENNAESLKVNAAAVQLNAFNSAASNLMELGKLFVDRHHLRKYFYDRAPVPTKPAEYEEAEAVAIVMLDFLANILIYVKNYPHLYPQEAWRNYVKDIFSSSPMLCEVFNQLKETGRNWYVDDLHKLMEEASKH